MDKWQRIVDRHITDVIGDGDVSHLPGAGKKLSLKDDGAMPSESRVAFKIMEDHDVVPDWIEAGLRLEQTEAELRRKLQAAARRYLREQRHAQSLSKSSLNETAELKWKRFEEEYLEDVRRYNREALAHNLTLPSGIPHRQLLRGEALIAQALRGNL